MDPDQLPCLDMDTDLYRAAMTGDLRYFHNATPHVHQRIIPCKTISQQQNVLHIAADFKRTELAKFLVDLFPVLLTRADLRGNTPLHITSKSGCSEREISEAALEMKNEMDDTALVRNGDLEVVKLLVQKNRKLLDWVNNHKESPLYLAVVRGFFEIAKFMLEGYSSLCSCEGPKGMTALHAAVIHTHKGTYVPESELYEEKFLKPIFLSRCLRGTRFGDEIDIMTLLLEKKKDAIRQVDEFGWSPLHYAAHLGHHEATKKLLAVDHGYVAGLCDVEQSCALHIAAKNGHSDVIEEILACRPDVYNLVDSKRRTILHIAAQFGRARVVKYILKQPNLESLINEPDKEGNTALHLAAIHRHYWVVCTLAADKRGDKRAINNEYFKTIDILRSDLSFSGIFGQFFSRMKLKHTGGGQSFHPLVKRELTTASNTSTESSGGASHTASNMNILGKTNVREVMEAKKSDRLKGVSKTNLLVAALVATVTFQAGLSPPGGFHVEGPPKGIVAVFSTDRAFRGFVRSNAVAFTLSTLALLLHFSVSTSQNYRLRLLFVKLTSFFIFISIVQMMTAFVYSFEFESRSKFWVSTIVLFSDIVSFVGYVAMFCFLCNFATVRKRA